MPFPVMVGGDGTEWIDTKYFKRLIWRVRNDKAPHDPKNEVFHNYPAKGEPKHLLIDWVKLNDLKYQALNPVHLDRIKKQKEKEQRQFRQFIKESERRLLRQVYKDCPQEFDKKKDEAKTKLIEELAVCFNTSTKRIRSIVTSSQRKKRRIKSGVYQFRRSKDSIRKSREFFGAKVRLKIYDLRRALVRDRQSYSRLFDWPAFSQKELYQEAVATVKAERRPEVVKMRLPISWKDFMLSYRRVHDRKLLEKGFRRIRVVKPARKTISAATPIAAGRKQRAKPN